MESNKEVFRERMNTIINEADTPAGKAFDVILLVLILISVVVVMLDSVSSIHNDFGALLLNIEWTITILFTLEYMLRIMIARKKANYIFSFYGIIDFLSIIPTYLSLLIAGAQFLIVIRALRLMRVFRILKLMRLVGASNTLAVSLRASRYKIFVFLGAVLTLVIILGSAMYLIEGAENGYVSIPKSIYWAIVTLTTVGYGDIAPATVTGQFLASVIMIMGYAIIAVPTGIISVEIARHSGHEETNSQVCSNCQYPSHDDDAIFCKRCGNKLRNHEKNDK
ncbi:MAG: ion transporter [Bacteroidales bacterium]|nr:ion transporter [Bacteroidales bacterium]